MLNDESLIRQLSLGSSEAFTAIYGQYWRQVYDFSKLYLRDKDYAEEIVQEVFIKVWESREFIKENDNFKGLLFIITRNLIFNKHRKKVNEDFYKMTILRAMEESYDIEGEIDAKDLSRYIDLLINELPPQRRLIFNLSRKEFKSYRKIAEQLNLSEKTVERQISEAIKFIRQNLLFIIYLYTVV
ncbi:RNA polymerase sigma-70 factor [Dysgonomonas termitidis]|uniref:RNA polymerase sigma-70 factor n=1 Tax=Dysgonomonas termitidis TaxID=1516126 RepID=A0ABV9L3D3_9BACT